MPRTKTRLPNWLRWLLAIFAVLLVIYAVAGFLVLPWWLQQQLPEQAQRHLGWQTETSQISANPFAMSVTLEEFSAVDASGEPVANAQQLYLNLSFLRLFLGRVEIEELLLEQPYLRLELDQDNRINLVEAWRNHSPLYSSADSPLDSAQDSAQDNTQDSPADDDRGFPLVIDAAAIDGGQILFRDARRPEQIREFRISPLQLDLSGIATFRDAGDAGRYQLVATLGDDQDLRWRGEVRLMPFSSSGEVELRNIQAESLWHFVGRYAAYDWRSGRFDLTTRYRLSIAPELQFSLSGGVLELQEGELFLKQDSDGQPALSVGQLNAQGVRFDWPESRLQVGDILIDDWALALTRTENAELDWATALPTSNDSSDSGQNPAGDAETESGGGNAGAGGNFRWSVQHLGMTQGSVLWRDLSLEQPAELGIAGIEADLNGLTGDPDQPVSMSLRFAGTQGGSARLDGEFTVVPFTLESSLQLADLPLTPFQPYLGQNLALVLESGTAGFDGYISLDDQQPQLTGSIAGNLVIDNVDTRLPALDAPFVSWQSLRLEPLQVRLEPLAIDVSTVNLMGLELTYLRLPNAGNSFARLTDDQDAENAASRPEDVDDDSPTPAVRIDRLNLEDAVVTVEDRAIERGFRTRIHQIGGAIIGLSNRKPQRGQIDLQGQVDEQGSLRIEGTLGALGNGDTTTLSLVGSNLALEPLTPYFAHYLGYTIAQGILELEMEYTLKGAQIDGSNEIVMQDFALGEPVDSPAAVDVPVKLGISLLRGPGGVIDISVPVSGDLSDPSFSFSDVVLGAFSNLVARAATAPFSVIAGLADLAGFEGENLGKIGFLPGTDRLAPREPDKLQALASALEERSGVSLRYRGATAPEWDGPALVLAAQGFTLPAADLEAQVRALENRLVKVEGRAALDALLAQYSERYDGERADRERNGEWARQLLTRLANGRAPEPGALRQLAEDRAAALRAALTGANGIAADRLAAGDTRNDAATEGGRVIMPFEIAPFEKVPR